MTIPPYLPYFVFAGTAATVIAILYGLNRSLVNTDWSSSDRARVFLVSATVLLGWLIAAVLLGAVGVYHANSSDVPTIQYGILAPIVIGAWLVWRSETAKRIIHAVPQQWLVGVQLYRALGVIFLILYAAGKLPGLFAFPAGMGDIAIGLLAPIVGLAYARTPRKAASAVAAWNVLGILDLAMAVGTGFATAPSLFQPIEVQPTSELMTLLPLVLIPTYLVPLSIVLHFASLSKLHREAVASEGHGRIAGARA
jgi:hypothetical protein